MPTVEEKLAFAVRLKRALKRSPRKVSTPTELALQFNLRHPDQPVTVQSAHKWLTGQSMPTVDKLSTLSAWLDVSLEWLRFGIANERSALQHRPGTRERDAHSLAPTADELTLLAQLRTIPEQQRALIIGIAEQFALQQDARRYD